MITAVTSAITQDQLRFYMLALVYGLGAIAYAIKVDGWAWLVWLLLAILAVLLA